MDGWKTFLTGAIITLLLFTFVFKPFGHFAFIPAIIICLLGIAGFVIYMFIKTS